MQLSAHWMKMLKMLSCCFANFFCFIPLFLQFLGVYFYIYYTMHWGCFSSMLACKKKWKFFFFNFFVGNCDATQHKSFKFAYSNFCLKELQGRERKLQHQPQYKYVWFVFSSFLFSILAHRLWMTCAAALVILELLCESKCLCVCFCSFVFLLPIVVIKPSYSFLSFCCWDFFWLLVHCVKMHRKAKFCCSEKIDGNCCEEQRQPSFCLFPCCSSIMLIVKR